MVLEKPDGRPWTLEDGERKLVLRGGLPGARVFDLAAASLRRAKEAGLATADRLALAFPASWCINSPADSRSFRRWSLPPQHEVWLALVDLLEELREGPLGGEERDALVAGLGVLAPAPRGIESVSKVLALLVPEVVPLLPDPAVAFVLGPDVPVDARAFIAVTDWFGAAVEGARAELDAWGGSCADTPFSAAQVLDRLLWFDSEGYRHFAGPAGAAESR